MESSLLIYGNKEKKEKKGEEAISWREGVTERKWEEEEEEEERGTRALKEREKWGTDGGKCGSEE